MVVGGWMLQLQVCLRAQRLKLDKPGRQPCIQKPAQLPAPGCGSSSRRGSNLQEWNPEFKCTKVIITTALRG